MQKNSRDQRERSDSKSTAYIEGDIRAESREFRKDLNPVDETVPIENKTAVVSGIVTDCVRLNIRKEPRSDAEILGVIDAASEIIVENGDFAEEFYKICTAAGVEGFCMKKYIALQK